MPAELVPSQAARDAYASAYRYDAPKFAEEVASGGLDYTSLCQAFARFEAAIRADALEQAAKTAEQHLDECYAAVPQNHYDANAYGWRNAVSALKAHTPAAIRAITLVRGAQE